MNHQPFRDLLLSEEKLSPQQALALQDHLETCEACSQLKSTWNDVESELRKSPQVKPVPGFTARWQVHLADYQQHRQKQKVWLSISATTLALLVFLGLLTTQIWVLLKDPASLIAEIFERLVGLANLFFAFQEIFLTIRAENFIYTFFGLFFVTGLISFMSVLWLSAYRKLSLQRRAV